MDGSTEQALGIFARKTQEADCWRDGTMLPLKIAAEGMIRELKKGSGRRMVKTKTPKVLSDDCFGYEVEFPNGEAAEYAANVIAENMFAQCDAEGNQYLLMGSIVDYKSDGHAVKVVDVFVFLDGRRHMRKNTIGWKLWVQGLGTTR